MTAPSPSFWWDDLGGPPAPRPPLPGPTEADVVIAGGGYTGLWTAFFVKTARPDWRVVVLDRAWTGFGASGRNGGWLSGLLAGSREAWARVHGRAGVVAAQRAMFDTVGEVARWTQEHDVDCDLVQGGQVDVATTRPQLDRIRDRLAWQRSWGFGDEDWRELTRDELDGHLRVRGAIGGGFTPHCARVHPAKLVRGLATACERAGVELHDDTTVTGLSPHTAHTDRGDVRARWVVRALEGFTADLRGAHRTLLPMNSSMIVTEPLGDDVWAAIGWDGSETLREVAHAYCYLQRTADGRIAIGGRGVPYRYGSRTDTAGEVHPRTRAELVERLQRLFGDLGGAGVQRAWGGTLGVARDWCPTAGADASTGLAWAGGYVGDGVSTANLAGRTLRDLLTGADTELTRLPWVGHHAPAWEPEPLRWIGVHAVYGLYRRADAREEQTGRPSPLAAAADLIAGRAH
jgi:glycine/D-amino acid oxidase-like deaminating enzyme